MKFIVFLALGHAAVYLVGAQQCQHITVDPNSNLFRDDCSRMRFFRGLNVVYKGYPWHPITSATGFDPSQSFNEVDAALWQSLGLNVARVGMMWPGVYPLQGQLNISYLITMKNMTDMMSEFGIWSLLDFHQDSIADLFCGEGIPTWAAKKYSSGAPAFPLPVDQPYAIDNATGVPSVADCNKHGWTDYYFAAAASQTAQALYDGTYGAANDFTAFWGSVAEYFSSAASILGYELINEPWPGNIYANPLLLVPGVADRVNLQPFYFNVSAAIRKMESPGQHRIVFMESITWDDFFPLGFDALPDSGLNLAAISYHYYSLPNFNPNWQLESRVSDAKRLQAGALLTEFEFGITNYTAISEFLDICDSFQQGYIGWEYKSYDPITGANNGLFTSTGQLDVEKAKTVSRTFPFAVAGTNVTYTFNSTTGVFTLNYINNPAATAPTEIYAGRQLWYPGGYDVSVTPAGTVWKAQSFNGTTFNVPGPKAFAYDFVYIQPLSSSVSVSVTITPM